LRVTKFVLLAIMAGFGVVATAPQAEAQVSVGVNIGPEPVCPYGFYDFAPYNCAPYGYYGPEWFNGGVFIGTGPWFHGPADFRGKVNTKFHPAHGYKGPVPERGAKPEPAKPVGNIAHFKGNEMHDARGNVVKGKK
jgi:hypothetical protein